MLKRVVRLYVCSVAPCPFARHKSVRVVGILLLHSVITLFFHQLEFGVVILVRHVTLVPLDQLRRLFQRIRRYAEEIHLIHSVRLVAAVPVLVLEIRAYHRREVFQLVSPEFQRHCSFVIAVRVHVHAYDTRPLFHAQKHI